MKICVNLHIFHRHIFTDLHSLLPHSSTNPKAISLGIALTTVSMSLHHSIQDLLLYCTTTVLYMGILYCTIIECCTVLLLYSTALQYSTVLQRGPGAARGPPGDQKWGRCPVHPYACRPVQSARSFPSKLPGWGVHGYSSFGWGAVDCC